MFKFLNTFYRLPYTVEERMTLMQMFQEELVRFTVEHHKTLMDNMEKLKIEQISHYPIHSVFMFNLAVLRNQAGVDLFAELHQSNERTKAAESQVRSFTKLYRFTARISQLLGHKFVDWQKREFSITMQSTYKVPRIIVKKLLEDYPYIWMLPYIEVDWTACLRSNH